MNSKLVWLSLIASFVVFQSSPAAAGQFSAVVNGKSHHFNSSYDWNEDNLGAGLEYQFDSPTPWKKIVMVNGFRDSADKMSYMAGAGLYRRLFATDRLSGFYVDAGLNAFLMTRDDVNNGNPFPGVLPSVVVGNGIVGLNLSYMPKWAVEKTTSSTFVDPTVSGILFLQVKVSVDQLLP